MHNVLDVMHFAQQWKRFVSDTRKAQGSRSPGHQTSGRKELNSSKGVVSSMGCKYDGEQCFQFPLSVNVR